MKAPITYAEALPPRLEVIEALAAAGLPSQWGVWVVKPRDGGKPAKVPMRLVGSGFEALSTNRPAQWGTLAEARTWLGASKEAKGLGVLMAGVIASALISTTCWITTGRLPNTSPEPSGGP